MSEPTVCAGCGYAIRDREHVRSFGFHIKHHAEHECGITLNLALDAAKRGLTLCTSEANALVAEIERLTRELAVTNDCLGNWRAREKALLADFNAQGEAIERLTRELDHFKNSGIIEVAIRNPNVSSYMDHWEGRATKAEAGVDRLRGELKAKELVCYSPCKAHRGLAWTMMATAAPPPRVVCPICEGSLPLGEPKP